MFVTVMVAERLGFRCFQAWVEIPKTWVEIPKVLKLRFQRVGFIKADVSLNLVFKVFQIGCWDGYPEDVLWFQSFSCASNAAGDKAQCRARMSDLSPVVFRSFHRMTD